MSSIKESDYIYTSLKNYPETELVLLNSDKDFTDTVITRLDGFIDDSNYEKAVDWLNDLLAFDVKNEEIKSFINETLEQKISTMDTSAKMGLFSGFQKDNFIDLYYINDFLNIAKENIEKIIANEEIPVSYEELRFMNYQQDIMESEEITYYGDYNIVRREQTKTTDSSEGKLNVKLTGVTNGSAGAYCTGSIKNNSSFTYQFVKVKAAFLNSAGEVIDTGWSYGVGWKV